MDYEFIDKGKMRLRKRYLTTHDFQKNEKQFIKVVSKLVSSDPKEKWDYVVKWLRKNFGDNLTELVLSKMSKNAKAKFLRYDITPLPIVYLMENKMDKLIELPTKHYH